MRRCVSSSRLAIPAGALLWLALASTPSSAQTSDLDGDGFTWPNDCNDSVPSIHPGSPESCNGADDDCNGSVDDAPGCVRSCRQPGKDAPDVVVTDVPGNVYVPRLVWTGSEYGIVWQDNRDGTHEVFFARLDASGSRIGPDVPVSGADGFFSGQPSVAWTGSQFGVAWMDERDGNMEIYFAGLDAGGSRTGDVVRVTSAPGLSFAASLIWNGSEFALAWQDARDGNPEIYFARLDRDGSKIGTDRRVTTDGAGSWEPVIVWNGSGYGVAWYDDRGGTVGHYFARLNTAGDKLAPEIRETFQNVGSMRPGLVWTGAGYGLSWVAQPNEAEFDTEVFFERLDPFGARIGPEVRVTDEALDQFSSELAWSGQEYAVASYDYSDSRVDVFVRTISAAGTPGTQILVTEAPAEGLNPSVAWTGHGFALAWEGFLISSQEVSIASVSCCGQGDRDADAIGDLCDLDDAFIPIDFLDGTTLQWQPETGIDAFDLYRGHLSLLEDQDGDGAADDYGACLLLQGSASLSAADPTTPPARDGFFYIPAGTGPAGTIGLGNASSGAPRTIANPQLCP